MHGFTGPRTDATIDFSYNFFEGISMPVAGSTVEQFDRYENQLIQLVPNEEAIGNKALLRKLKQANSEWTDELYWSVRNRLIDDKGQLERGRGKGGSVRRVQNLDSEDHNRETKAPDNQLTLAESDLYEPMAKVIKENWSQDSGLANVIVEVTAQGGRRRDGKWSRPDVTLASYRKYPYIPGRHFDLITFEIKPIGGVDVTCVYEALAHRRAATRAYTLLHIPGENRTALQVMVDEICSEAKQMGVGVIVAETPNEYDTWEELIEASRHEPDPQRLNDFIAKQVSQRFRDALMITLR